MMPPERISRRRFAPSTFAVLSIVTAGCGGSPPPPLESNRETCEHLGVVASEEDALALYRTKGAPIVLAGDDAFLCPCVVERSLGGAVESRQSGGATEARQLGGDTEARQLGGDTEARQLGGAVGVVTCEPVIDGSGARIVVVSGRSLRVVGADGVHPAAGDVIPY